MFYPKNSAIVAVYLEKQIWHKSNVRKSQIYRTTKRKIEIISRVLPEALPVNQLLQVCKNAV